MLPDEELQHEPIYHNDRCCQNIFRRLLRHFHFACLAQRIKKLQSLSNCWHTWEIILTFAQYRLTTFFTKSSTPGSTYWMWTVVGKCRLLVKMIAWFQGSRTTPDENSDTFVLFTKTITRNTIALTSFQVSINYLFLLFRWELGGFFHLVPSGER